VDSDLDWGQNIQRASVRLRNVDLIRQPAGYFLPADLLEGLPFRPAAESTDLAGDLSDRQGNVFVVP
jgi:hypothetical protein